jgi:hypothetical protein
MDIVAVAIAIAAAALTLARQSYLCELCGAVWVVSLDGSLLSWPIRRRMHVVSASSPCLVANRVLCCFSHAVVSCAWIKVLSKEPSAFTLVSVDCLSIGCRHDVLGWRYVATGGLLCAQGREVVVALDGPALNAIMLH